MVHKLSLSRPLVFFDLETTGTSKSSDKICQIYMLKLHPGGEHETVDRYIDPEMPPSKGAMNVHGLTYQFLEQFPTFGEVADEIGDFIKDCDLGGYNVERFDVPILLRELNNNGWDLKKEDFNMVDPYKVIVVEESRSLGSVYERFVGKEIEGAHDAKNDVLATLEVLNKQIDHFGYKGFGAKDIHEKVAGPSNKEKERPPVFKEDDGNIVLNIRPYRGLTIKEVYEEDPSFLEWMMNPEIKDPFEEDVRTFIKKKVDKIEHLKEKTNEEQGDHKVHDQQ